MKASHTNSSNHRQSNDEWPEIIDAAKIGERIKVSTDQASEKPRRAINIADISADDLKSLHRKDPFLYYSIPGVRSAKLLMKDIDESNIGESTLRRNCYSAPSRLQAADRDSSEQSHTVKRSTCISFECHPDLLLAEEVLSSEPVDYDLVDANDDPLAVFISRLILGQ